MDSNDILFIASLSGEAAGKNILCGQAGLDKVFS
jgi:hypothetical protein